MSKVLKIKVKNPNFIFLFFFCWNNRPRFSIPHHPWSSSDLNQCIRSGIFSIFCLWECSLDRRSWADEFVEELQSRIRKVGGKAAFADSRISEWESVSARFSSKQRVFALIDIPSFSGLHRFDCSKIGLRNFSGDRRRELRPRPRVISPQRGS
jgi:hypothetical protein